MSMKWGAGLHAPGGRPVDVSAYEKYIGRWSRLFVPSLLRAAEVLDTHRVLDVATGTGEAAVMALSAVGTCGLVVGADISQPMLEGARARLASDRFAAVTADAQALPFAAESFDAVLCQLGLIFMPGPAQALSEMRRVLRAGRRAAVCVISTADRAPLWGHLADALSIQLPAQRSTLHLSFSLADADHVVKLFSEAGFFDVGCERIEREVHFDSLGDYWAAIETGAGQMPQAYLALPGAGKQAVKIHVEKRLARFESNGELVMPLEMIVASGRA